MKGKEALKQYQLQFFPVIYSYLKTNLETELNIENQTPQFKITWIKTWLSLKETFENKIRKY